MKHKLLVFISLLFVFSCISVYANDARAEAGGNSISESLRQKMLKHSAFTTWLERWRSANPGLKFDVFHPIKIPQPSDFLVAEAEKIGVNEKKKIYSPNRARYLYFPDPGGEPDQEVWLYNRIGDHRMERLGCIGSSSWYDGGFWIDNEHFVILSTFKNTPEECWALIEYWDLLNDQRLLYKAVLKCGGNI